MHPKKFNVAIAFTLVRLIISPFFLPILLVYLLPYNNLYINTFLTAIFAALSLTDFLDGYFARKYNQTSKMGATLDHIADKFLINSTLIALLAVGKIYFLLVILFVARDFFVMGLRMIALEHQFSVPVGYLGKIKTACVMLFITWLILNPEYHTAQAHIWQQIELVLLTCSTTLTILSAYTYFRSFMQKLPPQKMIGDQH